MSIRIDNEFRTLITPLTEEQFAGLEALCLKYGIQDSLKTWNGILIDGHNRYEIAQKHGLEYKTEEIEFPSRQEVELWIIRNQLGRRNLPKIDEIRLREREHEIVAKEAEKRVGGRPSKADKISCPVTRQEKRENSTDYKIAKEIGMSEDTYRKGKAILESGDQEVIDKVRKKEMSINKAYREVKGLPPKKPKPKVEEPVVEEPLQFEEKVEFIETDESHEEVEDVAKDVAETAALAYVDDILSGITKIVNTVKYNRADVVDEISKLDCEGFSKDEFLSSVDECMRVLAKLQNGLKGLTVRIE